MLTSRRIFDGIQEKFVVCWTLTIHQHFFLTIDDEVTSYIGAALSVIHFAIAQVTSHGAQHCWILDRLDIGSKRIVDQLALGDSNFLRHKIVVGHLENTVANVKIHLRGVG